MSTICIQDLLGCYKCKSAADIYGRGCKHGLMFPIVLIMAGKDKCPNFEFDLDKVKEQLSTMETENKGNLRNFSSKF